MRQAEIQPTRTVYSYYSSAVREVISEVTVRYPHEVFLQSIVPGLDDFHEPVIAVYLENMREQLPGLAAFPHRYVTAGASEAIFHLLARHAAFRRETPLYTLEGDYEGYAGYGRNLGLAFGTQVPGEDPGRLRPGVFYLSNPSARDGNVLPDALIDAIGAAGHEIVFDATYVGATAPRRFPSDHPAVSTVLISLSKPFGLYYYRIGFCFMRDELLTLMVNKWFKNILSLIIAQALLERFRASEIWERYRPFQERAVAKLSERYGFPVQASDAFLLAHALPEEAPFEQREALATFRRGPGYRFCLTPFFLEYEKERS